MLLDYRDTQLMRLAGRYRWLPYRGLDKYGFDGIAEEVDKLVMHGLLSIARSKLYLALTPAGYELLNREGYSYRPGSKRAFAKSPALRRRLETSDIMLTCLRAGIDVLQDDMKALQSQPTFYPAFDLRPAMMNCANCSAFGHWGDTAYMVQYISPESPGMYRVNEFTTFYNLSSVFRTGRQEPMAMLLTGKSYVDIHKLIKSKSPSRRNGVQGFEDFRELYEKIDMPIHIVPCNETGARQLAIMSQANYRAKIAKVAYGQSLKACEIPETDGSVDGVPLVIGVDMDLRRIEAAVNAASARKKPRILVAALEEQILELLYPMFKDCGIVSLLKIEEPVLNAAFSRIQLYEMDRAPTFRDTGGAVHA